MIESNPTPGTTIAGKPPSHSRSVSPQPRIITSKPSVTEGQMSPPPRKLIFNNSKGTDFYISNNQCLKIIQNVSLVIKVFTF